jgi:hypothetical protein
MNWIAQRTPKALKPDFHHISILQLDAGSET